MIQMKFRFLRRIFFEREELSGVWVDSLCFQKIYPNASERRFTIDIFHDGSLSYPEKLSDLFADSPYGNGCHDLSIHRVTSVEDAGSENEIGFQVCQDGQPVLDLQITQERCG